MKPKKKQVKPHNQNQKPTPKVSPLSPPYAHAGKNAEPIKKPATPPDGWQSVYLENLGENGGQVTAAADAAQVSIRTVQRHRSKDAHFAQAEKESMEVARDIVESELIRRALEGNKKVYFNKDGSIARIEVDYSDTLLLRLLEKLETGSWKVRQQIETGSPGAFNTAADRKAALAQAMRDMVATGDNLYKKYLPEYGGSPIG